MAAPVPAAHLLAMSEERATATESREARLNRLLATYGDAMSRICAAYERNAAERDDLWQDMAFALWRALSTFRGECSEKSLVYRVARNRALTHRFRKRLPTEPLTSATEFADERVAQDTLAERASDHEQLVIAIQHLPETQRGVVVLKLEGLDDREIADVLGVTPNVVAVRLTRARESLRRVMQAESTRKSR